DEIELFSTCMLAEFDKDGWTKELLEKSMVNMDLIKKCDEYFMPFTVLGVNGTVWLNPSKDGVDKVNCLARRVKIVIRSETVCSCFRTFFNRESFGVFNSDFVHTTCKNKVGNDVAGNYIYLQMWNATDQGNEKPSATTTRSNREKDKTDETPSVFIFVLDSVANS
ncbi:hypothetical protein PENTCL1PPCAC_24333, partial [Pristionchus entomophagus]